MRYGIQTPPLGDYADARLLASLARDAEDAGWDGFFVWDDVIPEGQMSAADPWIATAAIALHTERIRIGILVTPLPRRRPWIVARQTATLDRLSGGRFIQGVGTGGGPHEWDNVGDEGDARVRGAMLDEALDILAGLWTGEPFSYAGTHYKMEDFVRFTPTLVQTPRIPIWVAGQWPNKKPARRAARWDGYFPIDRNFAYDHMMPLDLTREAIEFVREQRRINGLADAPFDFAHWGISSGKDSAQDAALAAAFAGVGVTWWMENLSPWVYGWDQQGAWPVEAMRERILAGPPVSRD